MSTGIYNAYKYEGGDIYSLLEELQGLRSRHIQLTIEMLQDMPAFKKVQGKDRSSDEKYQLFQMMEMSTREDMKSGVNSPFNLTASAVVFLHKDSLYVQFFGLDRRIKLDEKKFSDFHYQNSTDDTPEGMSYAEFKERGKLWDEIIDAKKGHHTASDAGMVFILVEKSTAWRVLHKTFGYDT